MIETGCFDHFAFCQFHNSIFSEDRNLHHLYCWVSLTNPAWTSSPQIFGMKLRLTLQKLRQTREQIQTTSFKTHLLFIQFSFPHGTSLLFLWVLVLELRSLGKFHPKLSGFFSQLCFGFCPTPRMICILLVTGILGVAWMSRWKLVKG